MTIKNLSIALLVAGALAAAAACGPSKPANDAEGATSAVSASSETPAVSATAMSATAEPAAPATASASTAPASSAAPTASAAAAPVNRMALVAAGDPKQGAKLFEAMHCNNCHGTPEKPKSHNLFKITWDAKHVDEAFEIIQKGHPPMPAFGDKLNDEAIGQVVAFLKANKK